MLAPVPSELPASSVQVKSQPLPPVTAAVSVTTPAQFPRLLGVMVAESSVTLKVTESDRAHPVRSVTVPVITVPDDVIGPTTKSWHVSVVGPNDCPSLSVNV